MESDRKFMSSWGFKCELKFRRCLCFLVLLFSFFYFLVVFFVWRFLVFLDKCYFIVIGLVRGKLFFFICVSLVLGLSGFGLLGFVFMFLFLSYLLRSYVEFLEGLRSGNMFVVGRELRSVGWG